MSLQITALSVQRQRRCIVEDVSLATPLAAGSLTALVGPNGAGKSTLIHALAGLLPSSGQLLLDGASLSALPLRQRSRQVALLPQSLPQSVGLSPYELLLGGLLANGVGRREAETRIDAVLRRLGLLALAMQRLDTLSGGQRQMVALAQVLARQPRLLLLDEPTSALDLRWQLAVLGAVGEDVRQRGAIGVIALHDLNLALRACDRVLVLAGGRLQADGAPDAVLDAALLRRVYGIAARIEPCSQGRPQLIVDQLLSETHLEVLPS
ncbi:ABC transporter ATP-binding protein [Vogesella indigofera]|uniref:ABC transporter ATP-binding protein n=1 Tax=Vogesella indigofera TaxID=45465 RepID=UPI0035B3B44F